MKHSIAEWFPTKVDFELFHVYCHQKDYRLSWAMNRTFRFELERIMDFNDIIKKKDETEEEKQKRLARITYSQFHFKDEITHREIYVIANRPVIKYSEDKKEDIFPTEKAPLLIPELRKVDYFAQLYGQFQDHELDEIEEKLSLIPLVNTAVRVNTDTLQAYGDLMH